MLLPSSSRNGIAMRMRRWNGCISCESQDLMPVYALNDLAEVSAQDAVIGPELRHSDYVICRRCQMLFAQWRQTDEEFPGYYDLFAKYEHRTYAQYPPPEKYLASKKSRSEWLTRLLDAHGLLRRDMTILHLRCDVGTWAMQLGQTHGITKVYGLDYFETNLRYAREQNRLTDVAWFVPGKLELPFDVKTYDLIVANHIITHALNPRQYLEDIRRHLNPGGAALLYGEIEHLGAFGLGWRFAPLGINNFHKQLLTEASLDNLLRLTGFEGQVVDRRATVYFDVLIRPAPPLPPERLPPQDPTPLARAFRRWGHAHRAYRVVSALGARVPRATRLARQVVRFGRSALGSGEAR